MQFQSSNPQYTQRFMRQFAFFVEKFSLFGPNESLVIGVSGGIDSMAMAFCLYLLNKSFGYSLRLKIMHINHNSRMGQDKEEEFVQAFAQTIGAEFKSKKLEGLNPHKNFEYRARLLRYQAFYADLDGEEKIVLAHHIDDSFEWTLLQSLRSSNIEGLVGIPLLNGKVIRPFMCVTKAQIGKFVQAFDLPFIEDPTNESLKYERNYIRNEVIPAFSDRYKQYLKHYVYRHNEISRRLGMHLLDRNRSYFEIVKGSQSVLIYSLSVNQKDYSGLEQLILEGVKHLNPQGRGVLSLQISKMIEALENHKKGPLALTKGIMAYLDYHQILLTKAVAPKLELYFSNYKTFSYDEFYDFLQYIFKDKNFQLSFPYLFLVQNPKLDIRTFDTSFHKDTVLKLKAQKSYYYPALKLLREWSKKKNRHKVLRLNVLLHHNN
jgi:tRNA(Ile)-lysidine synthase